MGEYKAVIMLGILGLMIFGIYVAFTSGTVSPLIDKMGDGFTDMVTNIFSGSGMDWGGAE